MSILRDIAASERRYEQEIEYWKEEAEYWKERYWTEILGGIKHNNEVFGSILKAMLERKP